MSVLWNEIALFAVPALFNIYFALVAIPIGFALAIGIAIGKASSRPIVSRICRTYIYFFRGSPFFIQLFAFYALALSLNMSVWKPAGIDGIILHPLFLGPLILALNTAAYTAEILYGAFLAVPKGEIDAARALGMTWIQSFRTVVWPHALRIAWPAYTNEVVFLFQATALIYFTLPVIGAQQDLMNKAGELYQRDFNVFLHFGVAALYFLVMSQLIFFASGQFYAHLVRHMPTRPSKLTDTRRSFGLVRR